MTDAHGATLLIADCGRIMWGDVEDHLAGADDVASFTGVHGWENAAMGIGSKGDMDKCYPLIVDKVAKTAGIELVDRPEIRDDGELAAWLAELDVPPGREVSVVRGPNDGWLAQYLVLPAKIDLEEAIKRCGGAHDCTVEPYASASPSP